MTNASATHARSASGTSSARATRRGRSARAALAIGNAGDDWLQVVDGGDGAGDAGFRHEVLPLIYENVGWLVGTLLVLAGSIYGLREAWITFDAAGRWASVAAALFTYHALFVIVGAVLARRSALAGQFLAGIGACLLPIAFVAVANLSAESRLLGGVGTVALAAAGVATIASVGRRFGVGGGWCRRCCSPRSPWWPTRTSRAPARCASCFLSSRWRRPASSRCARPRADRWARWRSCSTRRSRPRSSRCRRTPPTRWRRAGPVWRTGGPVFGAWLGAYVAALGLSLFAVRRMQPANYAIKRVLAAAVWLGFALTAGAGALAALAALRAASPPRASVLIALGAVLAACAQARWLAARRTAAFDALLLLASAACAVVCRVFLPADGDRLWWALAAFAPPAAAARGCVAGPRPPRGAQIALAFATIAALFVWSFEPARSALYPITLAVRRRARAWMSPAGLRNRRGRLALRGRDSRRARRRRRNLAAPNLSVLGFTYVCLAAAYAAEAAAATRRDASDGGATQGAADDISLLLFVLAAFASLRALITSPAFIWSPQAGLQLQPGVVTGALPLSAASLGLLLRSLRDRSALPSALGALGLAAAGYSPSRGRARWARPRWCSACWRWPPARSRRR